MSQRDEKRWSVLSILANDPPALPDNEEGQPFYGDPSEIPASVMEAWEAEARTSAEQGARFR